MRKTKHNERGSGKPMKTRDSSCGWRSYNNIAQAPLHLLRKGAFWQERLLFLQVIPADKIIINSCWPSLWQPSSEKLLNSRNLIKH